MSINDSTERRKGSSETAESPPPGALWPPTVLTTRFFVLGEEVQALGSETQEDPRSAAPAQQARGESADQEAAEKRPPLLHPQICSQSLEAVSNKEKMLVLTVFYLRECER